MQEFLMGQLSAGGILIKNDKIVLYEDCDTTIGLLAGATVMEAFYNAQENEPDNHFIQSLLETGYGPITFGRLQGT